MQHILTPVAEVSHIRKILDLIATIVSHVGVSYALLILAQKGKLENVSLKKDFKQNSTASVNARRIYIL